MTCSEPTAVCRWCAGPIHYPAGGPWRHDATNARGCRDLLGKRQHARPTRQYEEARLPRVVTQTDTGEIRD